MPKVVIIEGSDPYLMIKKGLDALGVQSIKSIKEKKVVIKPNLIINKPFPITTPVETVDAIIRCIKEISNSDKKIIVAEGSGWGETFAIFKDLGYLSLVEKYKNVELVDLNTDRFEMVGDPDAYFLKKFELVQTMKDAYIISAAVLKKHSTAKVTLSIKNMLGATLGEKSNAVSKKGRFHKRLSESIADIAGYIKPKLAIIDGRMGSIGNEIGGKIEKFNVIIISEDLVAADAIGSKILGYDPYGIKHIKLAEDKGVGSMKDLKIVNININNDE